MGLWGAPFSGYQQVIEEGTNMYQLASILIYVDFRGWRYSPAMKLSFSWFFHGICPHPQPVERWQIDDPSLGECLDKPVFRVTHNKLAKWQDGFLRQKNIKNWSIADKKCGNYMEIYTISGDIDNNLSWVLWADTPAYEDTETKTMTWLVVSTPLNNISQLGWLFPIYGKIKNGNQTTNQL